MILLVATGGYIGYNFLPKKTLVVNEVQVKLSAESADVADLTEEEAEYDRLVSSKEIADNISHFLTATSTTMKKNSPTIKK